MNKIEEINKFIKKQDKITKAYLWLANELTNLAEKNKNINSIKIVFLLRKAQDIINKEE